MSLSYIWASFIIIALSVATVRFTIEPESKKIFSDMVTGKSGDERKVGIADAEEVHRLQLDTLSEGNTFSHQSFIYKNENKVIQVYKVQKASGIVQTSKDSFDLCLGLVGLLTLFMGFMSIAEQSGAIQKLSTMIYPFFGKLFPEVPKGHPAIGHMMMNFSANLLGLDNAATPFGLKAMKSLQELNPSQTVASNAQIMFLCLHASGLTLIPTSIIAFRSSAGAVDPTDIFIPCLIATFVATMAALIFTSIRQRINLFQPIIFLVVFGSSLLIAAMIVFLKSMSHADLESFSSLLSNGLILFIFLLIVLGGLYKKINLFDAFVEGGKEGFQISIKIIPYLVGILMAISLLRVSGTFDFIIESIRYMFSFLPDTRFVDGLPTALIKPLSGSGARGMMLDAMREFGPDSFAGRLSCVLQGSSDTTFYVVAVYFGAVAIKNTRYTIGTMLLADLVGIITAILLSYLFFG